MGTTIEVVGWHELDGLVRAMDEVEEQLRRTTTYAVTRVCDPAGFTTGQACLLRPLGELLERVGEAFEAAGSSWRDDWRRVRDATAAALHEQRASDEAAAGRARVVADDLGAVA